MRKSLLRKIDSFHFVEEIPQNFNMNANARLWIQPDGTVLKQYVIFDETYRKNLHIISCITKHRHLKTINQLVLPLQIVYDDKNRMVGYTMTYCKGLTLDEVISSEIFSPQSILIAFTTLGKVIDKLPRNIRIGDLHGKNVLVECNGNIHIIDIDGFSICPKYIMTCPISGLNNHIMFQGLRKYWHNDGSLIVSKNSDLLCFYLLFLRWIMQSSSLEIYSYNEIFNYFMYLERVGFPCEIIEMFRRLFTEKRNIIKPKQLLKIDLSQLEKYQYKSFLKNQNNLF